MSEVAIFLGEGRAQVGGLSVPVEPAGRDGAIRLLPDGPDLRALTFGERSRLARASVAAEDPAQELAAAVLAQATTAKGGHAAAPALALHLAGAGQSEIGFAAAQSLLARQLGWSQQDLSSAPASDVDALAEQWRAADQTAASGWTRMVFKPGQEAAGGDPAAVALSLARDLLTRAQAGIDPSEMPVASGEAGAASGRVSTGAAPENRTPPHAAGLLDPWRPPASGRADEDGSQENATRSSQAHSDERTADAAGAVPQGDATAALRPAPGSTRSLAAGEASANTGRAEARDNASSPHDNALRSRAAPLENSALPLRARSHVAQPAPFPAARTGPAAFPSNSARAERAQTDPAPALAAPFAGWFDHAPASPGPRAELDGPSPWVWDRMVQPSATAPDLRPFFGDATAEDLLDDAAEALHSMADLRGIAP